jgi:hypothetical protein
MTSRALLAAFGHLPAHPHLTCWADILLTVLVVLFTVGWVGIILHEAFTE